MLSCIIYRNRLGAYLDGELSQRKRESIKAHLDKCIACQKQIEDIRGLEGLLHDSLLVPPLPDGFTDKMMREARRKTQQEAIRERPLLPMGWNLLRWFAGLSLTMRAAACVTILLAFGVGLSLNNDWLIKGKINNESTNSIYGLEWFEPTPPGSIGSVYVSLYTQSYQGGNGQ